jgi:hypothetical protein
VSGAIPPSIRDSATNGVHFGSPLKSRICEAYERLLKALSLVYGIESYVVLRDIWGASYREVEAVARFMLDALIESALRQAPGAPGGGPARSPR